MAKVELDIEQAFCRHVAKRGYRAHKLTLFSERGWPDRSIPLPGGKMCHIEFKHPNGSGRESPQQRRVRTVYLAPLGHKTLVTDDLDTAIAWFEDQLEIALAL